MVSDNILEKMRMLESKIDQMGFSLTAIEEMMDEINMEATDMSILLASHGAKEESQEKSVIDRRWALFLDAIKDLTQKGDQAKDARLEAFFLKWYR